VNSRREENWVKDIPFISFLCFAREGGLEGNAKQHGQDQKLLDAINDYLVTHLGGF